MFNILLSYDDFQYPIIVNNVQYPIIKDDFQYPIIVNNVQYPIIKDDFQ